jgi:hypothetical protein
MLQNFPRPPRDNGRGVHGPPGPQPLGFLTDWGYWQAQLLALNIKWVKLLDPGDGAALPLAEKLVNLGIFPVIRFYREEPNPGRITSRETDAALRYVKAGVFYFETNNEPDLALEWKGGKRPANWLDIVVNNFIAEADMIRAIGGYLLFPAFGPGGRGNPFQMIVDKGRRDILDGNCALAIHNYCLARPLDYPNDPVTLTGQPITQAEWAAAAPDYKKGSGPMWAWEMGWEQVNEWRKKLANPNANIMQDSTCFRAFEYFDALVNQAVGHSIPIFTTEGGYNVGQRAGTTAGDDPRWPKPSPQETAQLTLKMFQYIEERAPAYYFACMPWLLACQSMGYWQQHFEMQGPWYSHIFKFDWQGCDNGELPVVQLLKNNPGKERQMSVTNRRPGIWAANGHPGDTSLLYSWRPGAVTCFSDYLQANAVFSYKKAVPSASIIIRFQHPMNWQQDPTTSAKNFGREIAGKWADIKSLDPYVYFANEVNLHYENGDADQGRQYLYETQAFYQRYADWVRMTADVIKGIVPEMKLVTPPFAFGHHEDGAPDDNGQPKEGWAGYDYLQETIKQYFDTILTFHAYWGSAGGSNKKWLYDPAESSWYAFRWRRLLNLFKKRYSLDARLIIDEAGNFGAKDTDFTDQVIYYSQECLKDPRVLALTYFLWLDPTNSPGNLPNSWVQNIANLSTHLKRLSDMPDITTTTTAGVAQDVSVPPVTTTLPAGTLPVEVGITITIVRGPGLPLITGDYLGRAGVTLELVSPGGITKTKTKSGSKEEFGLGGFEFYATETGDYTLKAEGNKFIIPMAGKYTRLAFNTDTVAEPQVRLSSSPLPTSRAAAILATLEGISTTKGLFTIGSQI